MASVISNDATEEKTGIFFPSMFPTLSVVDSNLMMSVPPKFTAYQGMDAFYHAAEKGGKANVLTAGWGHLSIFGRRKLPSSISARSGTRKSSSTPPAALR